MLSLGYGLGNRNRCALHVLAVSKSYGKCRHHTPARRPPPQRWPRAVCRQRASDIVEGCVGESRLRRRATRLDLGGGSSVPRSETCCRLYSFSPRVPEVQAPVTLVGWRPGPCDTIGAWARPQACSSPPPPPATSQRSSLRPGTGLMSALARGVRITPLPIDCARKVSGLEARDAPKTGRFQARGQLVVLGVCKQRRSPHSGGAANTDGLGDHAVAVIVYRLAAMRPAMCNAIGTSCASTWDIGLGPSMCAENHCPMLAVLPLV